MSEPYDGRGGCRGNALGSLLAWLVGAGTLAGLLAVLLSDPPVPKPGTAAEIAARTAPIGRLTLAEPPPEIAAQPASAPVSPAVPARTEPQPETEPPAVEGPGARGETLAAVPAPEAMDAQAQAVIPGPPPSSRSGPEPGGAPTDGPPEDEGVGVVGDGPDPGPLPTGDHQGRQAAAPPLPPPPSYWGGPYRMVPVPRPDLPGRPYQLVPLPPAGR
jgi:hypothetical protein